MACYDHVLVITGYFYGIIHSINGVLLVLITGISGHNCNDLTATEPWNPCFFLKGKLPTHGICWVNGTMGVMTRVSLLKMPITV
jgi:hypothetical protein